MDRRRGQAFAPSIFRQRNFALSDEGARTSATPTCLSLDSGTRNFARETESYSMQQMKLFSLPPAPSQAVACSTFEETSERLRKAEELFIASGALEGKDVGQYWTALRLAGFCMRDTPSRKMEAVSMPIPTRRPRGTIRFMFPAGTVLRRASKPMRSNKMPPGNASLPSTVLDRAIVAKAEVKSFYEHAPSDRG